MRFIGIAYPLVMLIDVIMFMNFWQWHQQSMYEFEQRQMDLQVNYAVDASVHDMLMTGTHLGTDYATWGEMTIEPEVALDTYVRVLLRNIGWADTVENRNNVITTSIPFFCVAAYDGYYMYCKQQDIYEWRSIDGTKHVEMNSYPMVWTPKIPYSETVKSNIDPGDALSGQKTEVYLYNVGFKTYNYIADNRVVTIDLPIKNLTDNSPGTKTRAMSVINNALTDACNSALYLGLEGNVDKSWFLPASFSSWSNNNPVESPTVLTYMNRSDGMTQYETTTFGIGGAKITDADFCICYTDPSYGGKLYTWADNRELLASKYGVTKIEYIVSTAKEAAERGYFFDLRFREVA